MSSRSTSSLRPLAAAALAATTAVLALCAFASAASAAPAVTLTHDPDLNADPIVAVAGTGFISPTPPPVGLYAAQIAILEDGTVVANNAKAKYIRASGPTPDTKLEADGSFSSEVEVEETFGSGPTAADCAVDACAVATWLAHTNPTLATLYTRNPIYFVPTIVADPAQKITATGQTIAIDGGAVDAALIAGNGINMSQIAIVSGEVKTGPARWIRASGTGANKLTANGTFSSDLTLKSTFTSGSDTINCGIVQCKVAFWPGHTNPTVGPPVLPTDGQLIATQDISFAYSPSATVTPTTDLPETQQVIISGSAFNPASPGVYVSQVALVGGSIVTPPPGGGDGMKWVRPGGPTPNQTLNPDGTFETSVTVSKTFKDPNGAIVDCATVQCSVVTWKAHTNPTSATLYTSAPLSFKAPVTPPPAIPPAEVKPSATKQKQEFKLGTNAAKLDIVSVQCGSAACSFQKPKKVAVKVGESKLWLTVTGPKQAGAGKVAKFGVRVNGSAAKQLKGKKVRVKFKVQTSSDAGNRTVNVNTLLVGSSK
jgi:hypothetical protein